MQTTDFYAAISGNTASPIGAETALTPFGGPKIGGSTVSWTNFKAGPQPAEKFILKVSTLVHKILNVGNKVYNCKDWQVSNSTPMLDMQICKFAWI